MTRKELITQINEALEDANDDLVEQAYWFLMVEMGA